MFLNRQQSSVLPHTNSSIENKTTNSLCEPDEFRFYSAHHELELTKIKNSNCFS